MIVVALIATIAFVRGDRDESVRVADDPRAATVDRITLGSVGVHGVDIGDSEVLVASAQAAVLYRIDPDGAGVVGEVAIPSHVEGVRRTGEHEALLSRFDPDEIVRVDLRTGDVLATVPFASQPAFIVAFDMVWAVDNVDGNAVLHRLDPVSLEEIARFALPRPAGFLAASADSLWMASLDDPASVLRIDPNSGTTTEVDGIAELGGHTRAVAVDPDGNVWATVGDRVAHIDPASASVVDVVDVGRDPLGLATDDRFVWVANWRDGTVSRIARARSPLVVDEFVAGAGSADVATGFGSTWIMLRGEGTLLRVGASATLERTAEAVIERTVATAGGDIFVRCWGEPVPGRPTVLLEADVERGAGSWASLAAALAPAGRVCATDRALVGRNAADAVAGRSPGDLAADLRDALAQVGEGGPFLVVGHGWGALTAELLAHRFPESVTGLVLLDPLPIDAYDQLRPLLDDEGQASLDAELADDPELSGTEAAIAELRAAGDFGDLPLVVVAADPEVLVSEIDDGQQATERVAIVGRLQESLSQSSTSGELTVARGSGHNIPNQLPAVVIEAIDRVLERGG